LYQGAAHTQSSKIRSRIAFLLPSGLYRRLRNLTESAFASGLVGLRRITAGQGFHLAPKIAVLIYPFILYT